MKISYLWLKELVNFDASPRQLADDLSMLGIVVETVEVVGDDTILDLDLTTNRPDCLSHHGVAREVAAHYRKPLKPLKTELKESSVRVNSEVAVSIESPGLCSRYCARIVRGVKVAPSPRWLVERLGGLGIRSINNVVDVTNYVLFELGHPLHAFDLLKIQGGAIVIREARSDEKLVTLDGLERALKPGMLLIADRNRPLALAGVMGGADSEIGFASTDVLLESACFEPNSIRRTSKALGMHTEASHRFERGADVNATVPSIDRAAAMIQQLAGGEVLQGVVDAYPKPLPGRSVSLQRSSIQRVMGTEIENSFVERLLIDLNCEILSCDGTQWEVGLPSSRLDIEREIDLIEEIARHYGYDRFESTLPSWAGGARRRPELVKERTLKQRLVSLGYSEIVTYSFVGSEKNREFSSLEPVRLENPLSLETEVMRTSLVPGLLASLQRNYNRDLKSLRLYEMGRIYPFAEGTAHESKPGANDFGEPSFLGMIATGKAQEKTVHADVRNWNFFDLKGDLELLLESLSFRITEILWRGGSAGASVPDYYHPAVAAELRLNDDLLGVCGQLHPRVCDAYKIRQPVFLAEIPLAPWYCYEARERLVGEIGKYPGVQRDLSIVVDKTLDYQAIERVVRDANIPEVRKCFPFDLYFGEKLPSGKQSISLSILYQALDRTLVEEEVNSYHERILNLLQTQLGAQLRT